MHRTVMLLALGALLTASAQTAPLGEAQARAAFVEKRPELFLKHIPDDFQSVSVEGNRFDATALRQFFPAQFANMEIGRAHV